MKYKLLTPGPLTTTDSVKEQMLFDHCTWDEDYKKITRDITDKLLDLAHVNKEKYVCTLMQGSGTFGVESVLSSSIGKDEKLLILANGAYGERMTDIAKHNKINYVMYTQDYNKRHDLNKIKDILENDKDITHVSIVHSETTSGILNDIEEVGKIIKNYNKIFIVDAMSSFGGIDIPVEKYDIDFIISSANKCIQGVPGFSFIIAKKEEILKCKNKARSLSLDLYAQWETMNKDGKWRFTSPTHTVLAFNKALDELIEEGGIEKRYERYFNNNRLLINKMEKLGFKTYVDLKYQSPIITSFIYPENVGYTFKEMYSYIKQRGYAIYPGKIENINSFRIGNIGEIYEEDIIKLCDIIDEFLKGVN
ncbi:2-aminoethylphosphonate--pyruvate transaminase [Anaerofustis stercorihominis]|uniref:2-aminoethylphosphonate--pyruvate transaminase n=1 Tax=Anaerofustis stercorihominis DSM 17244 TaxID=445971 RepID=B1C913_9FIRM|nr:2-aminoethylphosphonate--pyruvate transaminase [Anaerofustis stercorihominis]EDS72073.1 2-aminoethylphosphonate--pyruvate transaminase [Anaerofustis stercorihominis DSM 17244]MCQ4795877.1 2-aminoethylphosphonate--pyruvate transaminase [Anaerofustis stercorihominis]